MTKRTGVLQTGFIPSTFEKEHHLLGGIEVPFRRIKEDGDYTTAIPEYEQQLNYLFDTYNCTAFGTLNTIEMYMLVAFGIKANYSERWLGIIAGTRPPGNDPHTVMEAIRRYGLIPEHMLPFSEDIKTVDEYYSFKNGDGEACYEEGRKWLDKYQFNHKWVISPENTPEERINNMKVSYKLSPPSLAVYAWGKDDRDVYIAYGAENHWVASYRYADFQEIIDSYVPYQKKVEQKISFCKIISIERKPPTPIPVPEKPTFWQWLKTLFTNFKRYYA